jgi:hypothetical protein
VVPASGSKKRKPDDALPLRNQTPNSRIKSEGSVAVSRRKVYKLGELREQYESRATSGLSDKLNDKVTEDICMETLDCWTPMVNALLKHLTVATKKLMDESMAASMSIRLHTELYKQTGSVLDQLVTHILSDQTAVIKNDLICLQDSPFTLTEMDDANDANLTILQKQRLATRVDEYLDSYEASGAKSAKTTDRKKCLTNEAWLTERKLNKASDKYNRELTQMARVLTYYGLATDEFVNMTGRHLQVGLLKKIGSTVDQALRDGLSPTDEQHCMKLLADDPRRLEDRVRLIAEREKLLVAKAELEALPAQAAAQA